MNEQDNQQFTQTSPEQWQTPSGLPETGPGRSDLPKHRDTLNGFHIIGALFLLFTGLGFWKDVQWFFCWLGATLLTLILAELREIRRQLSK